MGFKVKLNKAVLRFFYIVFFLAYKFCNIKYKIYQKTEEKPCMFNLPSIFVSTTLFPKTESHVSGIADPSIVVCIW